MKHAAARLGCSTGVVYYWIETGQLQVRRSGNRIAIPWNQAVQDQCRARIAESGHLNPAARRTKARKTPRCPAEEPQMLTSSGNI